MCREVLLRNLAANTIKWTREGMQLFEIKDNQVPAISIDSAMNVPEESMI